MSLQTSSASARLLLNQYRDLTDVKRSKQPSFEISLKNDNAYHWNIAIMVLNPESIYYGAYFKAEMVFPIDYPFNPPKFRFLRPFYHPNVYRDGQLCISILHAGEDTASGEDAGERWSPAQNAESVLISILSLLEDPNPDSPANVDASVQWRTNRDEYNLIAKRQVELSRKDIPQGFAYPVADDFKPWLEEPEDVEDSFFLEDANDDYDFGSDDDDNDDDYDNDDISDNEAGSDEMEIQDNESDIEDRDVEIDHEGNRNEHDNVLGPRAVAVAEPAYSSAGEDKDEDDQHDDHNINSQSKVKIVAAPLSPTPEFDLDSKTKHHHEPASQAEAEA
ncbi:ubiquitin-conjugating enzyme/RWD-like protein [Lipomyces japonicus]|uniref:ubiquitin-conjugating enzyme/RWD-like protein n=1 Tax=Lipomyces japonicus TaxID=56871 RepID=UPI0034CEF2D5